MTVEQATRAVIKVIGTRPSQVRGRCYAASEALYHLAGGKRAGLTPVVHSTRNGSHWWLRTRDGRVIDVTARQFRFKVPYAEGRGCGFLTKLPSKAAREILSEIR